MTTDPILHGAVRFDSRQPPPNLTAPFVLALQAERWNRENWETRSGDWVTLPVAHPYLFSLPVIPLSPSLAWDPGPRWRSVEQTVRGTARWQPPAGNG
jgi:hypothetical protein